MIGYIFDQSSIWFVRGYEARRRGAPRSEMAAWLGIQRTQWLAGWDACERDMQLHGQTVIKWI